MITHCPNCNQPLALEGTAELDQKVVCPACQHELYLGRQEQSIPDMNPSQLLLRALETPMMTEAGWEAPEAEEMNGSFDERYHVIKLLGRGGMGAVYLAHDTRLDRKVAIKILPSEMGENKEALARFEREAKALAALEHPNIVNVYDYGSTVEGHLYIIMEFIDGMDLHQLRNSGQIDLPGALEIISQVCSALHYAHGKGIVHRDIKPANVLVSSEGAVKVADFGLAKATSAQTHSSGNQELTGTGQAMGTPDYMAPEQRDGLPADHRADIYALGVMLYVLLTGSPPRGAWPPPSKKVQIDVRLDDIVIRALQENPVARYQAAQELKGDVDTVKTSTGGGPVAEGVEVDPLPSSQRKSSGMAKPHVAGTGKGSSSVSHAGGQPSVNAIVKTTKIKDRTMLLLGTFAILTLSAIAIYVGVSKKDGDTYNTVNNTTYQEIQKNYFSQIVVNGTTTEEELAKVEGIKPYGTLFIGISKETLSLKEAQDLAKRTGSTILDYTTDQPNKPAPLNQWITSAFSLQQKAWVRLHTQYQVADGKAVLSTVAAEARHHVLVAWQGPKELMMKAEQGKSIGSGKALASLGVNLVTNPGCELFDDYGKIAAWVEKKGNWEGAASSYKDDRRQPKNTNGHYFYAGQSKYAEIIQKIDISEYKNPSLTFRAEAKVASYLGQTDSSEFVVRFIKAGKVIKAYTHGSIVSHGDWAVCQHAGVLPREVDSVELALIARYHDGLQNNNGYFDDISFVVSNESLGFSDKMLGTTWKKSNNDDYITFIGSNAAYVELPEREVFELKECDMRANSVINFCWASKASGEVPSKYVFNKELTEAVENNSVKWKRVLSTDQDQEIDTAKVIGTWQKADGTWSFTLTKNREIIYKLNSTNTSWRGSWIVTDDKRSLMGGFVKSNEISHTIRLTDDPNKLRVQVHHDNSSELWLRKKQEKEIKIAVRRGIPSDALAYEGRYYKYYPSKKNWEQAKVECEARGGHLATANTLAEFLQIALLADGRAAWLGGRYSNDEKRWTWLDGSLVAGQHWWYGHPRDPEQRPFLWIAPDGHFINEPVYWDGMQGYVCEWDGKADLPMLNAVEKAKPNVKKIPSDAAFFGSSRYMVYQSVETWFSARKKCEQLGGRLADIDSIEEKDFLTGLVKKKGTQRGRMFWLDGSNNFKNGEWKWVTSGESIDTSLLGRYVRRNPNQYLGLQDGRIISKENPNHKLYGSFYICEWEGEAEERLPKTRIITDIQGRKLEVEILSANDVEVKVRVLKNKKVVPIPLSRLSEGDKLFLKKWSKQNQESIDRAE